MGPKRALDDNLAHAPKVPKLEPGLAAASLLPQLDSPQSDFSGSVKRKLANSSRTGQACDRCKIRKIRCDPRPEGCSPCAQNRTPCKTTDRITGKATTRGHTEAMEAENAYMRAQIAEMQAQLKDLGIEPRAPSGYTSFAPPSATWSSSGSPLEWGDAAQRRTSGSPLPGYAPAAKELDNGKQLPQFNKTSFGDNYLGVSITSDPLISNIKGTALNVFGHEIDITNFVPNEQDYDNSVMSYNHVIKVALGEDRVESVPFPPYPILNDYCTWYLRSLNPYTMLQDKPTLMKLVWRIGHDQNFSPSAAETVSIHMVIATLKYQISVRNHEAAVLEESHRHYRYALSYFNQLLLSHTWQDVQALAMISHHLRNFPKPGAAWMIISVTFLMAIELGLHRSVRVWADTSHMDPVEIEMRKRIFWTLYGLATSLSGKLGRPMPISVENIDVEFPEPMNDCLPGEDVDLTPYRKCSFHIGIQVAKYTVWLAKLYGTLYTVNPCSRDYDETLRHLELGIQQWKDGVPPELSDPTRASQDDYIFSLYLEYWHQEYRLLLYHPAICRSKDRDVINANLDKCLSASQKMLHACTEMRKFKSLDIVWVNAVAQIAAISTTLFVQFQRKDDMSPGDMDKLKTEMARWVDLMGEWGQLLGSGDKLKYAIHNIVERSLSMISESIYKRTASQSLAQAVLESPSGPSAGGYTNGDHQSQYAAAVSATVDAATAAVNPPYAGVPVGATYAYNNGAPVTVPQHDTNGFEQQPFPARHDGGMPPAHAAALQAATATRTPVPRVEETYPYTNVQSASNGHQAHYPANNVTPHEWHHFTRTYMQQVPPQGEFLNTATTLMALGGREGSGTQIAGVEPSGAVESPGIQASATSHLQWPGVQFSIPSNGHLGS